MPTGQSWWPWSPQTSILGCYIPARSPWLGTQNLISRGGIGGSPTRLSIGLWGTAHGRRGFVAVTLHWVGAGAEGPAGCCPSGSAELGQLWGLLAPHWHILGTLRQAQSTLRRAGGRCHNCSPLHLCQGGGFRRPFLILPRSQRDERSPCSLNIACAGLTSAFQRGQQGHRRCPWLLIQGCPRGSASKARAVGSSRSGMSHGVTDLPAQTDLGWVLSPPPWSGCCASLWAPMCEHWVQCPLNR